MALKTFVRQPWNVLLEWLDYSVKMKLHDRTRTATALSGKFLRHFLALGPAEAQRSDAEASASPEDSSQMAQRSALCIPLWLSQSSCLCYHFRPFWVSLHVTCRSLDVVQTPSLKASWLLVQIVFAVLCLRCRSSGQWLQHFLQKERSCCAISSSTVFDDFGTSLPTDQVFLISLHGCPINLNS